MSYNISFFKDNIADKYASMIKDLSITCTDYINNPNFKQSDARYHNEAVKTDSKNMRRDYDKALTTFKKDS
ncbi:hypothetical protein [Francisella marina]|uniref:hypothetical protein n=1 Tax=Francisella marina TaxID=2249302 RepID=UPI0011EF87E7|nr:hypothetical protein [Francisella marina]QEO58318.1 hypothetical protein F0R75_00475 [Francisella marina]